MSQLEVKEKELNKLKQESDQLVLNQHPASDKIEVAFIRFTFLLGKLSIKQGYTNELFVSILNQWQIYLDFRINTLDQGLASFFWKGPSNKYFRLAGHLVSLEIT